MEFWKLNYQRVLYALAILIAASVRIAGLGQAPLSDPEAGWALQALHLAQGSRPLIGPQPGLVLLSGGLFFVLGSSEFVARLAPAIAGTLIVLVPFLFRKPLGEKAALVAAFGLALDPALVSLSRQADGHMLALSFTLLGLGFLYARKPAGAGIFLGLAVLGGPSVWLGWFTMLIPGLLYLVLRPRAVENVPAVGDGIADPPLFPPHFFRSAFIYFAGSLFFVGTLFFTAPQGLSALGQSLASFFTAQTGAGTVAGIGLFLAAWLFYNPLLLILAALAFGRALLKKSITDLALSAWWLVALAIILLYPARQAADVVWVNVPMWALAARFIAAVYLERLPSRLELGISLLAVVLLVSAWLNFLTILAAQSSDQAARWFAILFMLVFLGIAIILITWGWSRQVAMRGASIGLFFLLALFSLTSAWRAAGRSVYPEQEILYTGPEFDGAALLTATVSDFSLWNTGDPKAIDLVIAGQSPSVQWLFRDFPNASIADVVAKNQTPSLVITGEQASLGESGTYAKLPFVKEDQPDWTSMQETDWLKWIIYRQAPVKILNLDLWVRTNLFYASPDFNK